jgi:hypothetical protein
MLNYYNDGKEGSEDFDLLCPAIVGYEGQRSPWWPTGVCTFLKNDLCELHDLGIKPGEGLEVSCQVDPEDSSIHQKYAKSWDNKKAQELTLAWQVRV